jgi:hypothetical protein
VRAACAGWRLDEIRDDAPVVASELVTNAVLHAGTACRLTLRYNAFGLTVEVRDYRPDRLPEPPSIDSEPPSIDSEPPERLSGLFVVDALTREWGIMPRTDDKTVWALLPVGDFPIYSRTIRKAAHDAVRAVLAHGRNTTPAATALRQITARLTEQHGAAAARDLTEELARELAAANSGLPGSTTATATRATSTTGATHGPTVSTPGSTTSTGPTPASPHSVTTPQAQLGSNNRSTGGTAST